MRLILYPLLIALVGLSGCGGSPDRGVVGVTGSTIASAVTVTIAPSTPPTAVTFQPTTVTTLVPVERIASGLLCRDLYAVGYGYSEAVAYWAREGSPDRMDADRNGIPCETVYLESDVAAFWGGTVTTTATDTVFSISVQGFFPDALPGSGDWLGSGCSPGSGALPDGIWWGYISDLSQSSLTFDLACLRCAAESDDDPESEEYAWVIENNATRTRSVAVSADAMVTCDWMGCPPHPLPYREWMDEGVPQGQPGMEGGVWIYVKRGVITEIVDVGLAG
jgi:hypothetical protein